MNPQERLEELGRHLQTYPDSVAEVSYGGDPPLLVPLGTLVSLKALGAGQHPDPVLQRFMTRLRSARPDLTDAELLALPVPASAGDQEVYSTRLGKWFFEVRMLRRALRLQSE